MLQRPSVDHDLFARKNVPSTSVASGQIKPLTININLQQLNLISKSHIHVIIIKFIILILY